MGESGRRACPLGPQLNDGHLRGLSSSILEKTVIHSVIHLLIMQIVEGLLCAGPVLGSGDTMNKIKSLLSWRLFSRGRRRQTINKYKITVK